MKKYLKTPEEVIDALHEGKTVFGRTFEKFELYRGFIIEKNRGGYAINSNIYNADTPFIKEPDPLKIEVGKFYKTRAGKKARCYCQSKQKSFFTIDGEPDGYYVWADTGRFWRGDATSSCDIIGPWED